MTEPINPKGPDYHSSTPATAPTTDEPGETKKGSAHNRTVSPADVPRHTDLNNEGLPVTPLKERSTQQSIQESQPSKLREAINQAHQVIGHHSSACALGAIIHASGGLNGQFNLIYQPPHQQPPVDISPGPTNDLMNIWSQCQQLNLLQQYNQQLMYGLFSAIEQQKQLLLNLAITNQLPPSPQLLQKIMPPVAAPQLIYLPDLSPYITQPPQDWCVPPQIYNSLMQPSLVPLATTLPIEFPANTTAGLYCVPQMTSIINPLYGPWTHHMASWANQLNQGQPVDAAAFYAHAQQSLLSPALLQEGLQQKAQFSEPPLPDAHVIKKTSDLEQEPSGHSEDIDEGFEDQIDETVDDIDNDVIDDLDDEAVEEIVDGGMGDIDDTEKQESPKKDKAKSKPVQEPEKKQPELADFDITDQSEFQPPVRKHEYKDKPPEIPDSQWVSVVEQLQGMSADTDNAGLQYVADKKGYYTRSLPKASPELLSSGSITSFPAFGVNVDVDVEAEVDITTEFSLEHELQDGIASAASNVAAEVDATPKRLRAKPKNWKDFVENDPEVVQQFQSQVDSAKKRRAQGGGRWFLRSLVERRDQVRA